MLIGQFFGTSAAEGIPAPFCRCAVCEQAREKKGVYQRKRSCFRLSESIMMDLGADAVSQCMEFGDVNAVNHVLVTHTHDDHLNAHMIMEAFWARKYRNSPLHYYFTDKAYEMVEKWRENPWILKGRVPQFEAEEIVAFHQLRYGERIEIDGIGVTPFKGNHQPDISFVESATRSVIPLLKEGDLFVIESTSPIGTTELMADLIYKERPELRGKINIAYCPERVLPGNVIYELIHNDRVIGGVDEASTERAKKFYGRFVKYIHRNSDRASACRIDFIGYRLSSNHPR